MVEEGEVSRTKTYTYSLTLQFSALNWEKAKKYAANFDRVLERAGGRKMGEARLREKGE